MKKAEVIPLLHGLRVAAKFPGVDFAYEIAKNIKNVEAEAKILEEVMKADVTYDLFVQEREAMAQNLAERDESGGFKVENNAYVIPPERQAQLNADFEELKTKHKEALDARQAQVASFKDFLDGEADITLYKIPKALLPASIDGEQILAIWPVLEQAEESK